MKRKILTIVLTILLITLIVLTILKPKLTNNNSKNETNRDFMLNDNPKANSKGENTIIYVGVKDSEDSENFSLVTIKVNKELSKEDQAKTIVSKISDSLGYKIELNSLEINENTIKLDLSKTGAPFDFEASYLNDSSIYFPSTKVLTKAVFDSIDRSFKSYFGEDTEVYFSADSENIELESISIDSSKPY